MTSGIQCPYCSQVDLRLAHQGVRHKVDPAFGPFDLLVCPACGSLSTENLPSKARLSEFYTQYDQHRPDWYNAATATDSLSAQYGFYARFLRKHLKGHRWADIGAGHGEVSNILASQQPDSEGCAIDIGSRPPNLSAAVGYISADLNDGQWAGSIEQRFDLVFAVAVLEHVLSPLEFTTACLSLVRPGGKLVLIAPDNGSLASRMLGRNWPYFEPGEHLSIPTQKGATACVRRAATNLGLGPDVQIAAQPVWVGYSLRYLCEVLRLSAIARFVPPKLALPLPTGILAVVLERSTQGA